MDALQRRQRGIQGGNLMSETQQMLFNLQSAKHSNFHNDCTLATPTRSAQISYLDWAARECQFANVGERSKRINAGNIGRAEVQFHDFYHFAQTLNRVHLGPSQVQLKHAHIETQTRTHTQTHTVQNTRTHMRTHIHIHTYTQTRTHTRAIYTQKSS